MGENDLPDFIEERDSFGRIIPKFGLVDEDRSARKEKESNNEKTSSGNKRLFKFNNHGTRKEEKHFDYFPLFSSLLIMVIFYFGGVKSWTIIISFGVFMYALIWFQSLWESNTFINNISMDKNRIEIKYTEEDRELILEGPTDNFVFERFGPHSMFDVYKNLNRKIRGYKHTSVKLVISNGIERISQHVIGDWTEDKMNLVVDAFNELKSEQESSKFTQHLSGISTMRT